MTMYIYYKKLSLLIVALTIGQTFLAQESVSKTIEKSLSINSNGAFYVENKYGNVTINGWDNETLEIIMNVKVFDKNEEEALSLIERILPEVKIIGETIYLKSEISEKKQSTFSRYFNRINPIKIDKNNVQIDFTIHIPKTIAVDITNKFGDVIINAFEGNLNTTLQHGDMWITNGIKNATLNLKFGKLKSKPLINASIDLKNAEMDLTSVQDLSLNSSGSRIEIDEINKLNITSNKDQISVAKVNKIQGELKFSGIEIENLTNLVDVTLKVTDFSIKKIQTPNPNITIDQESSEIAINVSETSFKFDAYLTEGVLKIPKTFSNVNSNLLDKNKKTREIYATYGNYTTGKVSLRGYSGTIILND